MTLHPDEQARGLLMRLIGYDSVMGLPIENEHDLRITATTLAYARLIELRELESDYRNKGYRTPALLTKRIASLCQAAEEEG